MKKIALLLVISSMILSTSTAFANTPEQNTSQSIMFQQTSKEQMRKQFEQRLNLTEKQKEKARQIHQQGKEEIKPIFMKIALKRQEIATIKLSRISEKAQKEKIDQINNEIKELEKQAQEIRKRNSQEFEKILTKKQKAELEVMKAEGRARFERSHKARPPFQGLGTPNLFKPILP